MTLRRMIVRRLSRSFLRGVRGISGLLRRGRAGYRPTISHVGSQIADAGAAMTQYRLRRARRAPWDERRITSNSSRERPEPTATQVSGDSAR